MIANKRTIFNFTKAILNNNNSKSQAEFYFPSYRRLINKSWTIFATLHIHANMPVLDI